MEKVNLVIRGMGCGGCVSKVTAAFKSLPGVTVDTVAIGSATVFIDPAKTTAERLVEVLAAAGFTAEATAVSKNESPAR